MSVHEDYHNSQGGIPIVIVGRGSQVMIDLVHALKPEYDVIHTCVDVGPAIEELPELLSGSQTILPASDIGTNISRQARVTRPQPRGILIGGGISTPHYEHIREAVRQKLGKDAPDGCQWLKSTMEHYPQNLPPGEPPLELIIQVAKKLLGELDTTA